MSELIMEDWKLKSRTVVKLYRTRSVLVYVLADGKIVDEFNSESTDSQLNAEHWFARIKKSYHRNSCLIIITNYVNLKMPIMH